MRERYVANALAEGRESLPMRCAHGKVIGCMACAGCTHQEGGAHLIFCLVGTHGCEARGGLSEGYCGRVGVVVCCWAVIRSVARALVAHAVWLCKGALRWWGKSGPQCTRDACRLRLRRKCCIREMATK